ncbi:MAG: PQQ-binding-like beta-propeller repeat protein [Halobacteriota archaeon]|nr:PQQ-binding-like beta-propeller repeat protein [Halobacteriota archaeon]
MRKKMQNIMNIKAASLISAILFLLSVTSGVVSSEDWQEFQQDKANSGIIEEKILGRSLSWSQMTHSDPWNMAGINVAPIVADDNLYVLDALGYIWSFDAITGQENAKRSYNSPTGPPYYQLSTPAYGDGRIYFGMSSGSNAGDIFAVDSGDVTSQIWEKTINEDEEINTPITYEDGFIYFGTWNGTMCETESGTYYCLDASNGDERWNYSAGVGNGYYWAGACIVGDYILFGDDNGTVCSLNKVTGTLVDEVHLGDVDSNSGSIRSTITFYPTTQRMFFSDGTVCGTSITGRIWAYNINTATGELSYAWHTSLNTYSKSSPVVYDGRVYVGDGSYQFDGRLYCIFESNGVIDWYFQVPDNNGDGDPGIASSPVISVDDEDLYIYFTTNCENGRLYCIDQNGNELWYFEAQEPLGPSEYILQGAALYKDESENVRVYFGNDGGMLYALDEGICGDVNADGFINIIDAFKVWNRASDDIYLESQWAADVDGNHAVNILDAFKVWNRASDPLYDLDCLCDI